MNRTVCLILICLLMVTGSAAANEASFEKSLARGLEELENAKYPAAIREFQSALGYKPEDIEATLYLGTALSRNRSNAAEGVLKKALSLEPSNPLTNMELGIYYYNDAAYAEAEDYFENLIAISPHGEFVPVAQEYLARIKEKKAGKKTVLRLLVGMQYDSNVILNPDNSPLPAEISKKSDWRSYINPGISYQAYKSSQFELGAGYSFYQSLHTKLTDFNLTQNLVDIEGKYHLSPLFTTRLSYAFEYLLLGGNAYDYAITASPALIYQPVAGYSTQLEYRYRNTQYNADSADRSGDTHLIGVEQKIPIGEKTSSRFGYGHEEEQVMAKDWISYSDRASAGITSQLPFGILVDVTGDYARKTYPHFAGGLRRDNTINAGVSVMKTFKDYYTIIAGYSYSRNKSNTDLFTYSRDITSLSLNVRY